MATKQMMLSDLGQVVFSQSFFDIGSYFNIPISKHTNERVRTLLNINDPIKTSLSQVLLETWWAYEVDGHIAFVKHVASSRKNVLYQIILGGHTWDGVYELALKGKKIRSTGCIKGKKRTLTIESRGNYSLASVPKRSGGSRFIHRLEFDSEDEFIEALLEEGLVSEDDLEIYRNPDEVIEKYLCRCLPHIVMQ